jgi:glycosyltransferase involved in cell wall biosynthesis
MRIVFIVPKEGTQPIGGFKVVYEYANGLVKRKHQVHVVHTASLYARGEASLPRRLLSGFRYFPYALRGDWKPNPWFALHKNVRLHWIPWLSQAFLPPADVYIATWWVTTEHLNAMRSLHGKRLYLIQHLETWSGPEQQVLATWKMPFEKIVIARWLQKIGNDLGESCNYIPNGLDFAKFGCDTPSEERSPMRIAMLFNDGVKWKGTKDGVAAIKLLKEKYPDLECELYGVQPRPNSLPSWIVYHQEPPQAELRRIYNRAAIFLAPSHSEGWGLPPSEAMMCGAAVVATDIGGHQEFCVHEQNALLVPMQQPERMAAAAARLIEDHALRIRLVRNGQESIQRFTWNAAVDSFEKLLPQKQK